MSRWGSWKSSSAVTLLSPFSSPGVHSASNVNKHQHISWGKVRTARTAGNSAFVVVPNVKVRLLLYDFVVLRDNAE